MKTIVNARSLFAVAASCIAAGLLAGCQKQADTASAPQPEIRGEAISAPVAPAAPQVAAQTPAQPPAAPVATAPGAPASPSAPVPPPPPATPVATAPTATPNPAPTAPPAATPAPVPVPSPAATTATVPAPPGAVAAKGNDKPGDYLTVGFEKLSSFNFDVPDESPSVTNKTVVANAPKPADQIPAAVQALDKKFVALKGFMLPLKVENGLITELLIMRDQSMCCYGAVPKINEWVSVKMTGKGVKPIMDQAVTMYGRLHVGEVRENGYLVGIYTMDGDKITGPLDL